MRYRSFASLVALACCLLAAPPARADLAIPQADATDPPAGQVQVAMQALAAALDEAAAIPGNSSTGSETKSSGPSSAQITSKGRDSSNGPLPTVTLAGQIYGSAGLFAGPAGTGSDATGSGAAGSGTLSQAAAPPAAALGEGSRYVPPAAASGGEYAGLATLNSTPQAILTAPTAQVLPPSVPIPAAAWLLGGGLLGLLPLRRSQRFALDT